MKTSPLSYPITPTYKDLKSFEYIKRLFSKMEEKNKVLPGTYDFSGNNQMCAGYHAQIISVILSRKNQPLGSNISQLQALQAPEKLFNLIYENYKNELRSDAFLAQKDYINYLKEDNVKILSCIHDIVPMLINGSEEHDSKIYVSLADHNDNLQSTQMNIADLVNDISHLFQYSLFGSCKSDHINAIINYLPSKEDHKHWTASYTITIDPNGLSLEISNSNGEKIHSMSTTNIDEIALIVRAVGTINRNGESTGEKLIDLFKIT